MCLSSVVATVILHVWEKQCGGRRHKENVRDSYKRWMEEQAQRLIDKTMATFPQGKIPPAPFSAPLPPAGAVILLPPSLQGPLCPSMMPAPHVEGPPMMPMMALFSFWNDADGSCSWTEDTHGRPHATWGDLWLALWWCPLGLAWLGQPGKSRRALYQFCYLTLFHQEITILNLSIFCGLFVLFLAVWRGRLPRFLAKNIILEGRREIKTSSFYLCCELLK